MGTGWLTRVADKIRLATGEPSTNAKYTDAELIPYIESAYSLVLGEVNRNSQAPLIVPYDMSIVADTSDYWLPPIVGKIIKWEYIADGATDPTGLVIPRNIMHPAGPLFTMIGQQLRFDPTPSNAWTLRLHFIPRAGARLHKGTTDTTAATSIELAATPTLGALDIRPNAYVGSLVRTLGTQAPTVMQTSVITAYNVTTRVATVAGWDSGTPNTAEEYEIAPVFDEFLEIGVVLSVARTILAFEGALKRRKTIMDEYQYFIREIRLQEAHVDSLLGEGPQRATMLNANWVR